MDVGSPVQNWGLSGRRTGLETPFPASSKTTKLVKVNKERHQGKRGESKKEWLASMPADE